MLLREYRKFWINEYLAAGFALFPCRGADNCADPKDWKKPLLPGWQATKYDLMLEPETLPAVFGVLLDATHMVLDYDLKRDTYKGKQLKELLEQVNLPSPLQTFIVQSANGGRHLYFSKPPEVESHSFYLPGFPAIEIKTLGRYVIGAGSVIGDKLYKVARGNPSELMELSL
jgi:hypothetical protein